jgi:riboflavin synthase
MFTGIVEEAGTIASIERTPDGIRLVVQAFRVGDGVQLGDRIAVNGCCLTAVRLHPDVSGGHNITFDLLEETWKRTSFAQLQRGSRVNLERALSASSRLGGHFVSGHVDGTGIIRRWEREGADHRLEIAAPDEVLPYLISKGSICVDGISLTVAHLLPDGFGLWIIPHTYEVTSLSERKVGDRVNLEADLLGKYVARLLEFRK